MEQANTFINQEFKHNFWLKTIRKSVQPKILHGCININKDGNYIIMHFNTGKPIAMIVNANTLNIDSKITFDLEDQQHLDTNFLHRETFYINNRIYLIQNAMPKEPMHIYIVELQQQRILPIRNFETKPSDFRINYSASLYEFKILMFGGLNECMQPLNVLDSFDVSTYKWEKIACKGKIPAPRHSHSAVVVKDRLILIGGTKSVDLFDKESSFQEVFLLDLKTFTWVQANINGAIPKYMAYTYLNPLTENTLLLLWGDRQSNNCEISSSAYNILTEKFEDLAINNQKPEFRYSAACIYNPKYRYVLLYGGFFFDKADQNSMGNEMDRLYLAPKEDKQEFEKLELYKGETYDQHIIAPAPKKEEELKVEEAKEEDDEEDEISFEELLEREKKLEEEEKNRTAAKKRDKKKKRKGKSTAANKNGSGGGGGNSGGDNLQDINQNTNK